MAKRKTATRRAAPRPRPAAAKAAPARPVVTEAGAEGPAVDDKGYPKDAPKPSDCDAIVPGDRYVVFKLKTTHRKWIWDKAEKTWLQKPE